MAASKWQGGTPRGGRPLDADEVRRLGRYASHQGHPDLLHEYDLGQFWVTDLGEDEPARRLHPDQGAVPVGPWFHGPMCDCGGCGAIEN
jgi:hypothetical protein